MAALTDMQQAFVKALVTIGVNKQRGAMAARTAGYSQETARQQAYQLMRNPKILAAIREEAELVLNGGVLVGAQVLEEIATDPMHKDRFKAATELMDRGGMQLIQKIEVAHTHEERTPAELVSFLKSMAEKNGLPTNTYIGGEGAIDAEFTEVAQSTDDDDRGGCAAFMSDADAAELFGVPDGD